MTNPESPLGYLHEIVEPDRVEPMRMYSASSDNPWSHWTEKHKAQCQYKCTPLYARSAAEPKAKSGFEEAFWQIAEVLDLPAMPLTPKQAFEGVMLPRLRELVAQNRPDEPEAEPAPPISHMHGTTPVPGSSRRCPVCSPHLYGNK
jgi:hypothetical protein